MRKISFVLIVVVTLGLAVIGLTAAWYATRAAGPEGGIAFTGGEAASGDPASPGNPVGSPEGDQAASGEANSPLTGIDPRGIPFPEGSVDHSFYPLIGAHPLLQCESCHANNVYAGTPTTCSACHLDLMPDLHFSEDCTLCHVPTAWTDVTFDHAVVNTSDCASCHLDERPANHYTGQCSNCHDSSYWSNVTFNHSGFTNCSSCHAADAPPNHYAGQCSTCHDTTSWSNVTFNHTGQTNCASCHAADAPPNHYAGQCSDCHNTQDWDDFEHNAPNLNCLACHLDDEPDDENHPHGQQCSDCHDTNSWDDDAPNTGLIPALVGWLTRAAAPAPQANPGSGLDTYADCSSCHTNP